jgi:hypothetical protein
LEKLERVLVDSERYEAEIETGTMANKTTDQPPKDQEPYGL